MKAIHILPGWCWLYNKRETNFVFTRQEKKLQLNPMT